MQLACVSFEWRTLDRSVILHTRRRRRRCALVLIVGSDTPGCVTVNTWVWAWVCQCSDDVVVSWCSVLCIYSCVFYCVCLLSVVIQFSSSSIDCQYCILLTVHYCYITLLSWCQEQCINVACFLSWLPPVACFWYLPVVHGFVICNFGILIILKEYKYSYFYC